MAATYSSIPVCLCVFTAAPGALTHAEEELHVFSIEEGQRGRAQIQQPSNYFSEFHISLRD
jgi:hypothetical protein